MDKSESQEKSKKSSVHQERVLLPPLSRRVPPNMTPLSPFYSSSSIPLENLAERDVQDYEKEKEDLEDRIFEENLPTVGTECKVIDYSCGSMYSLDSPSKFISSPVSTSSASMGLESDSEKSISSTDSCKRSRRTQKKTSSLIPVKFKKTMSSLLYLRKQLKYLDEQFSKLCFCFNFRKYSVESRQKRFILLLLIFIFIVLSMYNSFYFGYFYCSKSRFDFWNIYHCFFSFFNIFIGIYNAIIVIFCIKKYFELCLFLILLNLLLFFNFHHYVFQLNGIISSPTVCFLTLIPLFSLLSSHLLMNVMWILLVLANIIFILVPYDVVVLLFFKKFLQKVSLTEILNYFLFTYFKVYIPDFLLLATLLYVIVKRRREWRLYFRIATSVATIRVDSKKIRNLEKKMQSKTITKMEKVFLKTALNLQQISHYIPDHLKPPEDGLSQTTDMSSDIHSNFDEFHPSYQDEVENFYDEVESGTVKVEEVEKGLELATWIEDSPVSVFKNRSITMIFCELMEFVRYFSNPSKTNEENTRKILRKYNKFLNIIYDHVNENFGTVISIENGLIVASFNLPTKINLLHTKMAVRTSWLIWRSCRETLKSTSRNIRIFVLTSNVWVGTLGITNKFKRFVHLAPKLNSYVFLLLQSKMKLPGVFVTGEIKEKLKTIVASKLMNIIRLSVKENTVLKIYKVYHFVEKEKGEVEEEIEMKRRGSMSLENLSKVCKYWKDIWILFKAKKFNESLELIKRLKGDSNLMISLKELDYLKRKIKKREFVETILEKSL